MAKWDIFLFDFDGTLVNSEQLQHRAYLRVAEKYGIPFAPDFSSYLRMAHFSHHGLRDAIHMLAPALPWQPFYEAKKRTYLDLLETETPELMAGVAPLLLRLAAGGVTTCVVTHSSKEQTDSLKAKLPLLQTIGHWITREDYHAPKPASDSYSIALRKLNPSKDKKVVGFEDSVRGLQALLGVDADAFLISSLFSREEVMEFQRSSFKSFSYLPSLEGFAFHA